MKDGGTVALDWGSDGKTKIYKNSPVLIVVPTLTGDANGLRFLCKTGNEEGFRVVVFNKRGHGGNKLTTPRLQTFGK